MDNCPGSLQCHSNLVFIYFLNAIFCNFICNILLNLLNVPFTCIPLFFALSSLSSLVYWRDLTYLPFLWYLQRLTTLSIKLLIIFINISLSYVNYPTNLPSEPDDLQFFSDSIKIIKFRKVIDWFFPLNQLYILI